MTDIRGLLKNDTFKTFVISSVCSIVDDPVLALHAMEDQYGIHEIHTSNGTVLKLKPNELASLWNISHEIAKQTLQNTTQLCPRNVNDISHHQRYHTNDRMLRYERLQKSSQPDTKLASKRIGKSISFFHVLKSLLANLDELESSFFTTKET